MHSPNCIEAVIPKHRALPRTVHANISHVVIDGFRYNVLAGGVIDYEHPEDLRSTGASDPYRYPRRHKEYHKCAIRCLSDNFDAEATTTLVKDPAYQARWHDLKNAIEGCATAPPPATPLAQAMGPDREAPLALVHMDDGSYLTLREYEQRHGAISADMAKTATCFLPNGSVVREQPKRQQPARSKPATKDSANALSNHLKVNDAALSIIVAHAVRGLDEIINPEEEYVDRALQQVRTILGDLGAAYDKFEHKCSTPLWEQLLEVQTRANALRKRCEGLLAKRDKEKAEKAAQAARRSEADVACLALVKEAARLRGIAEDNRVNGHLAAAARVYTSAKKLLQAPTFDASQLDPERRATLCELQTQIELAVAQVNTGVAAAKAAVEKAKKAAKKAAKAAAKASSPPPAIPEDEEYVPELPPSPDSPPPLTRQPSLPIAEAPTAPVIPEALVAGTSAPVSTLSQGEKKKRQKERQKERARLAKQQEEERRQLRAAQWASRQEAEMTAQQARAQELADADLQRALRESAEEAQRAEQARAEQEAIEPPAPPPTDSPESWHPESWQATLRRQQAELDRLRALNEQLLRQVEAAAAPPPSAPLTAAALAALDAGSSSSHSAADDDADDDAYSIITPSEAPTAISTATDLRNECAICHDKVPNAACKPCGCVKCCQQCLARYMLKTKGTRRACPWCRKPMTHYAKHAAKQASR